ncbi:CorA-like Mg2+ transporter protein [mine drainage metagenome]|uniref:CorA-like Mg2+ transporter protein n=1 Tax=mine drainage metagenome TaxID=410659 RepID=A0A1J5RRV1_9ZZZZ
MLINCVAYQDGRKLADIPIADISDYLARPDCFVWVALFDATPAELQEMQEEFSLHELAVEDARHGHQRPKIEEYGDSLFAVMHLPEMDDRGELGIGELSIFVGGNYVLSVRNRSRQGFLGVRQHRTDVRAEGQGDGVEAHGRAADGSRGQAARQPRAPRLHQQSGVPPRCL